MPDVQVRITTTGAEQAVAAFGQVTNGAQRFGQSVGQATAAAAGHERAVRTGTGTFADLWTQIWAKAVNDIIMNITLVKEATTWVTSVLGGVLGFFGIHFQRGGSFIATRPTPLMVGETGAERVSVTPLAGAPAGGTGGGETHFHLSNVVMDEVGMAKFAKRVAQIITAGPVSRVG